MAIRFRCHDVYVVMNDYPRIAGADSVVRPATSADLASEKLGVLTESGCVPLSKHERAEIIAAGVSKPDVLDVPWDSSGVASNTAEMVRADKERATKARSR